MSKLPMETEVEDVPPVALLVATGTELLRIDVDEGLVQPGLGLGDLRPTCVAAGGPASTLWCGTTKGGVLLSEDGGRSWRAAGLADTHVTALAVDPSDPDLLWAGTEPSALWTSPDRGRSWERRPAMESLPSAPSWSFPPRPDTHHVRWIACRPGVTGHLWVAVEAGALLTTRDGGDSWRDRVTGGPHDTHELAVHPARPDVLRVSAGDGYLESQDGGATWTRPNRGLDVGYLRSVAIDPGDPDTVVVSAASHAHAAYAAGYSDGRLYRRVGAGGWQRVRAGWPEPPTTIAPLLVAGTRPAELWAADERGVHGSVDGGEAWTRVAAFESTPHNLRGLAVVPAPAG